MLTGVVIERKTVTIPSVRPAAVSGHKNMLVLRGYDRTGIEALAQTAYLDAQAASAASAW